MTKPVYIIDAARTPFLKARGRGPFTAADLAVQAGRSLLARQNFSGEAFDEVITGCVMPSADEANISRIIALRLGCGQQTPAWTVQRNCASGLQALDSAAGQIASARSQLVLAGGTEAMSHAPLLFTEAMVDWLAQWMRAKSIGQRMQLLARFRFGHLAPVIALLRGLTDPTVGLSMGQTAENLAYKFAITREQMDNFSARSHQRLAQAQDAGYLQEISSIISHKGDLFADDDGLRRDSTPEALGQLKAFFDKKYGMVTAGNSSQVSDGAAYLILASEKAVKQYDLPVRGRIVDTHWAALDPAYMGLGPVHAATPLMQRHKLGLNDIDYWEINEAFAVQVLACIEAWKNTDYCKTHLGLAKAWGELEQDKLNVDGGAVAIGHPVGASGARIVMHLLSVLERTQSKRGIASICIGGGQGGAMLIERV